MKLWVATKPISNRRFSLGVGEKIPTAYTAVEAIRQLKALHGEDSIALIDVKVPIADIESQQALIGALQAMVTGLDRELSDVKRTLAERNGQQVS
jgi:hypothetical protein